MRLTDLENHVQDGVENWWMEVRLVTLRYQLGSSQAKADGGQSLRKNSGNGRKR